MNLQDRDHLGSYWKYSILDPTPKLLNESLHFVRSPGDLYMHWRLKSADLADIITITTISWDFLIPGPWVSHLNVLSVSYPASPFVIGQSFGWSTWFFDSISHPRPYLSIFPISSPHCSLSTRKWHCTASATASRTWLLGQSLAVPPRILLSRRSHLKTTH